MAKKAPTRPEMTTYLLTMKDGTRRKVTVPSAWKVTFGPLVPGSKDTTLNSSGATSLRFWDKANQKAVFVGVESFRDMSIAIEEEVVKRQEETFFKDTPAGRKAVVVEGSVREWRNPDQPHPVEDRVSLPKPGTAWDAGSLVAAREGN